MSLVYGPPRCADCGREIKHKQVRCPECQAPHRLAWRRAWYARHAERLRREDKAWRARKALEGRGRAAQ